MSNPKEKPQKIDYAIGELQVVSAYIAQLQNQIYKSIDYLERCKNAGKHKA